MSLRESMTLTLRHYEEERRSNLFRSNSLLLKGSAKPFKDCFTTFAMTVGHRLQGSLQGRYNRLGKYRHCEHGNPTRHYEEERRSNLFRSNSLLLKDSAKPFKDCFTTFAMTVGHRLQGSLQGRYNRLGKYRHCKRACERSNPTHHYEEERRSNLFKSNSLLLKDSTKPFRDCFTTFAMTYEGIATMIKKLGVDIRPNNQKPTINS